MQEAVLAQRLLDAVDRVEHDKASSLPAIVVIGTDAGIEKTADRDAPEIQEKVVKDGIRIDVVITLSGIFRDLMPLQTRLLAEAALLAASAEEPIAQVPATCG